MPHLLSLALAGTDVILRLLLQTMNGAGEAARPPAWSEEMPRSQPVMTASVIADAAAGRAAENLSSLGSTPGQLAISQIIYLIPDIQLVAIERGKGGCAVSFDDKGCSLHNVIYNIII